jgi:hypothetical protein
MWLWDDESQKYKMIHEHEWKTDELAGGLSLDFGHAGGRTVARAGGWGDPISQTTLQ